ncbi:hypothetical protein D9M72_563290 [compost metagenome]
MADLLQRRAEAGGEQFDVVPQVAGGLREGLVGQDQRAGKIVLQADATDLIGLFGAEAGTTGHPIDLFAGMKLGDLQGDLEVARCCGRIGIEGQDAGARIEAADRLVAGRSAHDPNAVTLFQIACQRRMIVAFAEPELARQPLGKHVDLVNVVVDEMKEVAHLFIRRGFDK